tara:strand:+ start:297 stop:470 length:174 start_codon:yes stop_codon:yes gene_type:complete
MSKRRRKKVNEIWEDYEPDGRDLAAHLRVEEEFIKENPDFDAADYFAQQQSDIQRGK